MIPGANFLSPIIGGVGFGLNLLDSILGRDKFDYNKWRDQQIGEIEGYYNKAKNETQTKMFNLADADIGNTANKYNMASGVAGINNPARLGADTVADIMSNRDKSIANAFLAFNQQEAGAKQQVSDTAAKMQYNEELNAPSWRDYASNIMNSLTTDTGQSFLGAVAGGVGSLFKNNGFSTVKKPITKDTTDYGTQVGIPFGKVLEQSPDDIMGIPPEFNTQPDNPYGQFDLSGGNMFVKRLTAPFSKNISSITGSPVNTNINTGDNTWKDNLYSENMFSPINKFKNNLWYRKRFGGF